MYFIIGLQFRIVKNNKIGEINSTDIIFSIIYSYLYVSFFSLVIFLLNENQVLTSYWITKITLILYTLPFYYNIIQLKEVFTSYLGKIRSLEFHLSYTRIFHLIQLRFYSIISVILIFGILAIFPSILFNSDKYTEFYFHEVNTIENTNNNHFYTINASFVLINHYKSEIDYRIEVDVNSTNFEIVSNNPEITKNNNSTFSLNSIKSEEKTSFSIIILLHIDNNAVDRINIVYFLVDLINNEILSLMYLYFIDEV
ncbi:MAG: hypothetical protein OEY49_08060 [Candidatus Heimdallarchaeota archaeon]|nr:hypothetical protein [Candidatus Heimdallarchaeota archaeon]